MLRLPHQPVLHSSSFTLHYSHPHCGTLPLKCDGTRAETRFRLSAKRTSPFKSAGASVQSTNDSRDVRISGSIAGYTMFRSSAKSTGYPLHWSVSLSFPLPWVTVCHHISTGLYCYYLYWLPFFTPKVHRSTHLLHWKPVFMGSFRVGIYALYIDIPFIRCLTLYLFLFYLTLRLPDWISLVI